MVKPGYKQTEVGEIPEDWELKTLSDITVKIIDNRGKTPPLSKNNEIELIETASISFVPRKPNYYKVTKFVSTDTYRQWFRAHPEPNDILISTVGEYSGASAFYTESRGTIAQNLIALRIQHEIPSYIFSWTRSSVFRLQLSQVMMSQAQPSLRVPWLMDFKVPLPSSNDEQKAIAKALSDVDALIASQEKLIAKKRDIKTATMQQLLTGKKRLSGFGEGKGYKQTELGQIPEDWDVVSLIDIGQPIIGLTYKPSDVADYGTLVLRSSNVQQNVLVYENNVFVDMDVPERVVVQEGDLLICVRNGSRDLIGKCALIDENAIGYAFGAFMSVFRSKDSKFIFYQFQSNIIMCQINEIMGATINQITNKDMGSFKVPFSKESDCSGIVNLAT